MKTKKTDGMPDVGDFLAVIEQYIACDLHILIQKRDSALKELLRDEATGEAATAGKYISNPLLTAEQRTNLDTQLIRYSTAVTTIKIRAVSVAAQAQAQATATFIEVSGDEANEAAAGQYLSKLRDKVRKPL